MILQTFPFHFEPSDRHGPCDHRPCMALALLLLLATIVLGFSPNFHQTDSVRNAPYGGDFLQEWVGGHIVTSVDRGRLYDADFFSRRQHDPSKIGFRWNANRYYPPVYPPGYYLIVSPLSQMHYAQAAVVWLAGSLVCLVFVFCCFRWFHPMGPRIWLWGPSLAVLFTPLLLSLSMGHKSIFILFVFTATYLFLYHRRSFWAGLAFGLIGFKPHLIVLLALLMLVQGDWRFLLGLVVSGSIWIALSLYSGAGLMGDYLAILAQTGAYSQSGGYQFPQAHGLINSITYSLGWMGVGYGRWLGRIAAILAVLLMVLGMRERGDVRSARFAAWFSAIVVGTVLTSPHFYQYDLTILLLPIWLAMAQTDLRDNLANRAIAIVMALFVVGAGYFEWIAVETGVQISLFLLIAWWWLLIGASRVASEPKRIPKSRMHVRSPSSAAKPLWQEI